MSRWRSLGESRDRTDVAYRLGDEPGDRSIRIWHEAALTGDHTFYYSLDEATRLALLLKVAIDKIQMSESVIRHGRLINEQGVDHEN